MKFYCIVCVMCLSLLVCSCAGMKMSSSTNANTNNADSGKPATTGSYGLEKEADFSYAGSIKVADPSTITGLKKKKTAQGDVIFEGRLEADTAIEGLDLPHSKGTIVEFWENGTLKRLSFQKAFTIAGVEIPSAGTIHFSKEGILETLSCVSNFSKNMDFHGYEVRSIQLKDGKFEIQLAKEYTIPTTKVVICAKAQLTLDKLLRIEQATAYSDFEIANVTFPGNSRVSFDENGNVTTAKLWKTTTILGKEFKYDQKPEFTTKPTGELELK